MSEPEKLFETSFEEHRREQERRWREEWTDGQRMLWLEEALAFAHAAGIDYLKLKHERIEREIADRKARENS